MKFMQEARKLQLLIGSCALMAFVLAALGIGVFLSRAGMLQRESVYHLSAEIKDIGELKLQAPVKVGGYVVGHVTAIELNLQRFCPTVTLAIHSEYCSFPQSARLSVRTAGLLGDTYLALNPHVQNPSGGMLAEGSKIGIENTEGAILLEDLIKEIKQRALFPKSSGR